ncbi:MAG TPA: signal recognition particle-docking protein FtsY [Acidimicrobiales bacterium]|nr:signal recognition particle-docking protein FtsY [Acidimicrobiales bacterium]
MIAVWIVLGIVVLALVAVTAASVTRRRGPVEEPSTRPTPTRPGAPPAPARPPAEAAPVEAAPVEAAPVEAPAVEAPAAPPRFFDRLGKARGLLSGYLGAVRAKGSVDAATWDDLEEALLRADVGVVTTDALLADLRRRVAAREVSAADQLLDALRTDLVALLSLPDERGPEHVELPDDLAAEGLAAPPTDGAAATPVEGNGSAPMGRGLRFDAEPGVTNVWLFVGVNGVGKTTTVGKVARREAQEGRSVLLAAGDTFRAAAGEQLAQWAERSGAEIVRGAEGGDPSAIVFDAVQRAGARGNDLVLADTAGRLHTKVNLVEELKKIRRVADRPPGRVTEVLLVLDATTGQNGLVQARQFTEAVEVTGVVLTKLDGTAKGGVVVAIQRDLGLPVKLVGLGEGPDDLVPFDPAQFVDALLG